MALDCNYKSNQLDDLYVYDYGDTDVKFEKEVNQSFN